MDTPCTFLARSKWVRIAECVSACTLRQDQIVQSTFAEWLGCIGQHAIESPGLKTRGRYVGRCVNLL